MTDQITVPRATWDAMRKALEHILSGALSLPRFAEDEGRAAIALAGAVQTKPAQRTGDCLLTGVCASEGHHIQHRLQGHLTDEQERTSFEAWIAKDCGDLRKFGCGLNTHYSNDAVNNAWTGWKQRAAASVSHAKTETAPPPEGRAITSESAANAVQPQVQLPAKRDIGEFDPKKSDSTYFRGLGWNECIDAMSVIHPQATEPAWRPIETAPVNQEVIVAIEGGGVTIGSIMPAFGWTWYETDDEPDDSKVIGWQPKPAAPEAKQ